MEKSGCSPFPICWAKGTPNLNILYMFADVELIVMNEAGSITKTGMKLKTKRLYSGHVIGNVEAISCALFHLWTGSIFSLLNCVAANEWSLLYSK